MKIYGHPMSTCTRKVLATLVETNTPYEFVLVDFAKGEHKQPAHMARQPFGQVPALEDNGFAMFESRAMSRYINEKAGNKLSPSDVQGRAKMEQWMSVEASDFTPPAMKFVLKHVFGFPIDQATLDAAAPQVDTAIGIMNAHLAKQPYFAGDQFSLADIAYMPYVDYAMKTPLKDALSKQQHLMAWWNKVSERPSWRKVTSPS